MSKSTPSSTALPSGLLSDCPPRKLFQIYCASLKASCLELRE
uniref:Uncharacterized protein n=1 Tax=Arundo donax TaxID=35708 RepID=A0A0A8ZUE5_ARUDO